MDRVHASELSFLLRRNVEVAGSGAFSSGHPLLISAVGEMAINLRECLHTLNIHYGLSLKATHDIVEKSAPDVSSLISRLRHSFAHSSTTGLKEIEKSGSRLSWNFFFGKGNAIQIGELILACEYEDDFCVNFGANVVLFKRHLLLAHNYCAYAFKSLKDEWDSSPSIFSDPVVLEHAFWDSAENDLSSISYKNSDH